MYMGDFIVIEEKIGPDEYRGCSVSTGTPFIARIDDDKRDLFSDDSWIKTHPSACRFLRPSGEKIVCTIHETSPVQCKAYRCVIIRVCSQDGMARGFVTGTLALHSDDPALKKDWKSLERQITAFPEDAENLIAGVLMEKGYVCT
ncbi:MAG: hypothetical protein WC502_01610 [Methanolinea sp.]